jgi:hypothetical protein
MSKLERLASAALVAGVCVVCLAPAGRPASALESDGCISLANECSRRESGADVRESGDAGAAAGGRAGRMVAAAQSSSPQPARGADCDQPAAGPEQIPEHLRDLTATATTIEGPRGITVDFVVHPLPPYPGKPWSHWGEGLVASNGRYYTAIGDHLGADANSYLYEYDPATKTLRAVGDVLTAYGKHRKGDWGYGKIHGQISEGACGQLYFHTYWGKSRRLRYGDSYTGDMLMRYDPAAQQLVSLGVKMPEMGTPSTQLWAAGGLFYGEATHPGKGSWPDGKVFWVYDIAREEVIFTSPEFIDQSSGRDIAVDREGRAYYSGEGRDLLRYDPATNTSERIASFPRPGRLRASSEPAPDGKIFMLTDKGDDHFAYLFDPQTATLSDLGALPEDTADLAISASGEVAYFTPGAHGKGRRLGFPLMEIDRSGNMRTIVELGPLIDGAGGPYPAGTYSYSIDQANPGDVYILANAGPRDSNEAFGQPLMMVVHLPESELR